MNKIFLAVTRLYIYDLINALRVVHECATIHVCWRPDNTPAFTEETIEGAKLSGNSLDVEIMHRTNRLVEKYYQLGVTLDDG